MKLYIEFRVLMEGVNEDRERWATISHGWMVCLSNYSSTVPAAPAALALMILFLSLRAAECFFFSRILTPVLMKGTIYQTGTHGPAPLWNAVYAEGYDWASSWKFEERSKSFSRLSCFGNPNRTRPRFIITHYFPPPLSPCSRRSRIRTRTLLNTSHNGSSWRFRRWWTIVGKYYGWTRTNRPTPVYL